MGFDEIRQLFLQGSTQDGASTRMRSDTLIWAVGITYRAERTSNMGLCRTYSLPIPSKKNGLGFGSGDLESKLEVVDFQFFACGSGFRTCPALRKHGSAQ